MKNIALALAIVAGFAGTAIATATEEKAEVATTEVAATTDEKTVAPTEAASTEEVSVEGEKKAN